MTLILESILLEFEIICTVNLRDYLVTSKYIMNFIITNVKVSPLVMFLVKKVAYRRDAEQREIGLKNSLIFGLN